MFYPDEMPDGERLIWRCPKCGHLPHFEAIISVIPGDEFRANVLARSAELCDQVRPLSNAERRERITVKSEDCPPGRGRCESCGESIGNYHGAGCAALVVDE